jgi:putative membrane protein
MQTETTLNIRSGIALIIAVSATAIALIIWLVYGRETTGAHDPSASFLPVANTIFNALSATCMTLGFVAIRRGKRALHRNLMLGAVCSSTLFLLGYLTHHWLHGDTAFHGEGIIRPIYFFVLVSHIAISVVALPMILTTLFFAGTGQFQRHRKIARITLPIWLYISVTGVLVFVLLKNFSNSQ